jgi:hypothetical protein
MILKFEDHMLKNGKYDSKIQSNQFIFWKFKKIQHIGRPQHSSISALPGLDRKKIIFNLLAYSCFAISEVSA